MTDKNTVFQSKKTLNAGGKLVDLSTPKVMGIINITPDSFFNAGRTPAIEEAVRRAEKHLAEGAGFLDIGAYSSRPRAEHISPEEELNRLIPALQAIVKAFPDALISIDTFRAEVARVAVQEGAHIINDIAAGELDEQMFDTVARLQVPYILMHMKGTPQTMQDNAQYDNILLEVSQYFVEKTQALLSRGVRDIVIDPGFGFAKRPSHSYALLNDLEQLKFLGLPLLAGVSRKSMISKVIGTTADEALNGTTAANTIALLKGADILRVHDVKEAVEAVKIVEKLKGSAIAGD